VRFAYAHLTGKSDTPNTITNPPFTRDVVGIFTTLQYPKTAEI